MTDPGPSLEDRKRACLRPDTSVVMQQSWKDLLFLHWPVDPKLIQEALPPGLSVDTYKSNAFIGLIPFYMRNIRPRYCPPVPGISYFLEMNVRTYVYDEQNRPGVWFYSLDANQSLAVAFAKHFFHLPYEKAKMSAKRDGKTTHFRSLRNRAPEEELTTVSYTPRDPLSQPEPGSLEYFLLERYLLFAWNKKQKQLYSGNVHHAPYPALSVDVQNLNPGVTICGGFPFTKEPPVHQVFSPGVEVDVFALQPVLPK